MFSADIGIVLLALIIGAATLTDIRSHRIPNVLSLGGMALGLALQFWTQGAAGMLAGLGGIGIGLLIFIPFYALGGMAAGDVKLMGAVGAFLGPVETLLAVAFTLMAGGVLAFFVLVIRNGALDFLRRYLSIAHCLLVTGRISYIPPAQGEAAMTRFPYALAILTGTAAALWWLS